MTSTYSSKEDVAAAVVSPKLISELRTHKSIRIKNYTDFSNILKIKYHNNEEEINKNEDNEFDRVMYLGLTAWKKEEDGYEIDEQARPGDRVVFIIRVENNFTSAEDLEIEDIEVEVTIADIDDEGDDEVRKWLDSYRHFTREIWGVGEQTSNGEKANYTCIFRSGDWGRRKWHSGGDREVFSGWLSVLSSSFEV